jgi:hypothetical protein
VNRRTVLVAVAAVSLTRLLAAQRSTDADVRAGFNGIWNSATATPLERPAQLKDKPFFTPEEAAQWERQVAENNQEPHPRRLPGIPAPAPTTRSTGSSALAPSRRCGPRSSSIHPMDAFLPSHPKRLR